MSTLAQQLWTRVADRARRASGGDAAGQRLLEDLNHVGTGNDDDARLLSRWEPELCISMLRVPTPINHAALRKLLARASREWTVEFVERGGLAVLLEALERLGGPGTDPGGGMERAMSQLRVVECIREVMNCKEGLSFLLDNGEQVHQLVNGLDSQNTTVKMQVFELLCALCMYSTRGHTVALDALFVFATARGHRYRFSPLVSELRTSQSDHYSTTILAFANCIVQGADSLEARVRLRNELLGVGLGEELSKLRRDPCDELCVQLEAFDDNRKDDEEQLTTTQELLELSQFQVFQTLQEKLADTPHALSLQTVLLNLAQVDQNNDVMWSLLEDVTSRALDGSLQSTQRRVSKMHTKTRNASVQTPRPRGGRRNGTVRPRVKTESTQTETVEVMVTDSVSVSTAVQTDVRVADSVSTQTESDWNCNGESTENCNPMDCNTSETVNCNIPPPPPLPFICNSPPTVNCNVPTPVNCNGLTTVNCNAPPSPPLPTVNCNAPPPPPLPITCNGPPPPPLPSNCNGLPLSNCNAPPSPPLPMNCNGPPPPPLPSNCNGIPSPNSNGLPTTNCNVPPPPPMNFAGPPPPPPMNCNGPPPPPPMNCNGPPPPPPMNGNGPPPPPMNCNGPPPPPMNSMGPPPPPMQSAEEYFASPTRHSLPSLLPSQWTPDDSPLVRYNSLPHPKKRMKTLNWTKIPPNKNFANTVWKDSSRPRPMPIDMKQIEELFCQRSSNQNTRQNNTTPASTPKSSSSEPATLNVLDSKRSLGVNIMLRQFKDLGVDGLLDAIREGRGDKLGADKLRGLLRLLPEQDEISLIRTQLQQQKQVEQNGGAPARLGDAENFYLRLSEVPSYALRVRAMLQREEFGPSAEELRPQLATVLSACETLVSNASLREFLTLILQLGNLLNAGSYAGNAVGFRLSTLPRLLETRANKPRMTFLHFAVDVAAAQPSCLAFLSELGLVQEAAKLSLESIEEEVRTLVSSLKKLQEQMERIKNPEISAQFDDFLKKAEAEVADLETKLAQLDEASARLARHFCEDEAKFQLTECLSLISDFISKTQLAIKENDQRRVQEARLAKQQMAAAAARAVHSVGVKRSRRGRGSTDSSDGEETCVVDKLMKEIRSGTFKLRRCAPA